MQSSRVSKEVLQQVVPALKVLELPPGERDEERILSAAEACMELSFLRSCLPEELHDACRQHLRIDKLRAGEAICLQGMDATAAYVVLSGTVSAHVRKDLIDIPEGAHNVLHREWKHRAKATGEAAKATARNAHLEVSGGAPTPAPPLSPLPPAAAASSEAAAVAPAPAAAQTGGSSSLALPNGAVNLLLAPKTPPPPKDTYLMLPTMYPDEAASGGRPASAGLGKPGGNRPSWKRASLSLGLSLSTLSAAEVRSRASKLVGTCVTLHSAGDAFGAPNSTSGPQRSASAVANSTVVLLVVPRAALSLSAGAAREQHTLEWLRRVPLLKACTLPTLTQLLQSARRRRFSFAEPLARAGETSQWVHLIVSGEVRLSQSSSRATPAEPEPSSERGQPASPPAAANGAAASAPGSGAAGGGGELGQVSVSGRPERGGDSNTPRDMVLRTIGAGQIVPCAAHPSLAEAVRYPFAARVATAHVQLLTLDCRFVSLLLSRQEGGSRAVGELTSQMGQMAQHMAQLAADTDMRWRTELVTADLRIAPTLPSPPAAKYQHSLTGTRAVVTRPAIGQRRPPHVMPAPPPPPKTPPPPDRAVSAPSKWTDPSRVGPIPLPLKLEPAVLDDEGVDATYDIRDQAFERDRQELPQPLPEESAPDVDEEQERRARELEREVALMQQAAFEQNRQLQALLTPRSLRKNNPRAQHPTPDPKAITAAHPPPTSAWQRQEDVRSYLAEANTLARPALPPRPHSAEASSPSARLRQRGSRPPSRTYYSAEQPGQPSPRGYGSPSAESVRPERPRAERPYSAQSRVRRPGTSLSPRQQMLHEAIYHQPGGYQHEGALRPPSPFDEPRSGAASPTQPTSPRFCVRIGNGATAHDGATAASVPPSPPIHRAPVGTATPAPVTARPSTAPSGGAPAPASATSARGGAKPGGRARGGGGAEGFTHPVDAHVQRLRASRGAAPFSASPTATALPGSEGYRAPLTVTMLNDDMFLKATLAQAQRAYNPANVAAAKATEPHKRVADAVPSSGSWQAHKRPPLVSNTVRRTFEDELDAAAGGYGQHFPRRPRRQPHARTGAAPSQALFDASVNGRAAWPNDAGPAQTAQTRPDAKDLQPAGAWGAGGFEAGVGATMPTMQRSAHPMSPRACSPGRSPARSPPSPPPDMTAGFGRPVHVDGSAIAAVLATTTMTAAPPLA